MSAPSPRPTREQVEAMLRRADRHDPDSDMAQFAAEVRALRAVESTAAALMEATEGDYLGDYTGAKEQALRDALAARTPQPAEYRIGALGVPKPTADTDTATCPLCATAEDDEPCSHGVAELRAEVHRVRAVLAWSEVNDKYQLSRKVKALGKAYGTASRTIADLRGLLARRALAVPQPAVPDGPATPASVDVRMESPTAPDWGGELTDDGRQLYHHAWDSTDGNVCLWVGPCTAEQSEPSWAVIVQADGVDVVLRCTPAEVVEWADEVKAAVDASAVLVASEPDVLNVRVVCGDVSGPDGVGGECVLPPGHPHVDGIGGQWPAVPDGEDVPARLEAAAGACEALGWIGTTNTFRDLASQLRECDEEAPEVRAAVAAALARPDGEGALAVHAGALALALHAADCGCGEYDEVEDPRYITAVRKVLDARDVTPPTTVVAAESAVGNLLFNAGEMDPGELARLIVAEVRTVLPTPVAWPGEASP